MNRLETIELTWIRAALVLFFALSCSADDFEKTEQGSDTGTNADSDVEQKCNYQLEKSGNMMLVTPGECNIAFDIEGEPEKRVKSFSPIFGNNPNPEPVPRNYFFVVRESYKDSNDLSRNILINFMGGGACWSGTNCLDSRTNYVWDDIKSFIEEALHITLRLKGFINDNHSKNPFKDWILVLLPYTTGDIHFGSNDQEYINKDGVTIEVNHRGHDNFLAALRYLKDTYPPDTVEKIFVNGQSAGAYGAIFNFPYVKETYKNSTIYCLGDAGNGVFPQSFVDSDITNWKVRDNLPDWIPGIDRNTVSNASLGEFYKLVADHYSDSRFGQYTTMYDHSQRYFYYVMLKTDELSAWEELHGNGKGVPDDVSCDWTENMLSQVTEAEAAPNYNAYVAPGEAPTITTQDESFDRIISNGVPFITWINQMLDFDPVWETVICDEAGGECRPPPTLQSPKGINCR